MHSLPNFWLWISVNRLTNNRGDLNSVVCDFLVVDTRRVEATVLRDIWYADLTLTHSVVKTKMPTSLFFFYQFWALLNISTAEAGSIASDKALRLFLFLLLLLLLSLFLPWPQLQYLQLCLVRVVSSKTLPILLGSLLLHDQYVNYGLCPSSASPCQMSKDLKPNFPHLIGSHHWGFVPSHCFVNFQS